MLKIFESKVEISPDVLFQEINGESVLLNLNSESYFGLDAVGTRIWQLMQETNSLQGVLKIMLDEYDVDEALLLKDCADLFARLSEAGLVKLSPAT